jgi:peptidyl-prolyl cis-trans isomerase SurA
LLESFEDLAKQFSQDKSTSSKGGVLNRFGSGQLSSEEFENKAFSLQTPSQISEPFQTQYGWHIVKLIEKHPLKTIEELTPELEDKISKDERSRLIANSLTEKLRKKYKVAKNKALLDKLTKVVTDAVYEGTWEVPSNIKEYTGVLFSFENQKITGDAFLSYLHSQQKSAAQPKPVSRMVATNLDAFIDQQLNQYYNDTLENEFPEFSAVMDEYRDGLLLFELMEKEIWEKSKTDSLGLAAFHLKNIQKYQWKKRYNVVLLSTTKADIAKKAHKLLGKNKTAADIKVALNQNDVINIMAHEGVYEEGVDLLPKTVTYQKGMLPIVQEGNYFYVISVKDILPSGPKLLEECRGRVVNDYQQYLEENWVSSLKEEYKVQVNQPVFEKVKQQIKK